MRTAMAFVAGRIVLKSPEVLRSIWLLPVRDFMAMIIWISGWAGRGVAWRGEHFSLSKGKLIRRQSN
jgi:hypothetical protein